MAADDTHSDVTQDDPAMAAPRVRLSTADRRSSIISAAKSVFATNGYDGAKTLQIANAAGVSEALVYRHFSSKAVLYREVLRQVVQEQDQNMAGAGPSEASASGLFDMIVRSIRYALRGEMAPNAEGMRLMFGSMAGDGDYARLVYRRAKRLVLPQIRRALGSAAAAGDLDRPIDAENVVNFLEHVTSMIQLLRRTDKPVINYPGTDEALLIDAVRFCARGIGLRSELVERMITTSLGKEADETAT